MIAELQERNKAAACLTLLSEGLLDGYGRLAGQAQPVAVEETGRHQQAGPAAALLRYCRCSVWHSIPMRLGCLLQACMPCTVKLGPQGSPPPQRPRAPTTCMPPAVSSWPAEGHAKAWPGFGNHSMAAVAGRESLHAGTWVANNVVSTLQALRCCHWRGAHPQDRRAGCS